MTYFSIKRYSFLIGIACLGLTLTAGVEAKKKGPPGKAAESKNMRLVGYNDMQSRSIYNGHVREQGGRYIAYVGYHSGSALNPDTGVVEDNGNAIVDVTDPRNPVYLIHLKSDAQNPGVGRGARSLQTCSGAELGTGDPDTVYMHREVGNDVHEIWDVTIPETPVFLNNVGNFVDGTHKNWWECSTGIAYLTNGLADWNSRVMSIWDLKDPGNPVFIRDYIGLPGAQPGGDPTGRRMTDVHEPLYLDGKVYMAHGTRTEGILQILDNAELLSNCVDPEPCATMPSEADLLAPVISRLDWPDFQGVHTAVPILGMDLPEFAGFGANSRDMLVVVNESTRNECTEDMHQMVYIVDITDAAHPIPVSTYFVPEGEGNFCERGGRFGAHTTQWNIKETHYRGRIVWISYFNAGVRGVDIRDPYNPKEVAYYIPAVTENTDERCVTIGGVERCKVAIQTNNLDVDDRGFIYAFDRANTGMHILEPTGKAKKIANFSKKSKKKKKK